MMDVPPPKAFKQDPNDRTGDAWKAWKARFKVYLRARALDDASGKRQVNLLLHLLGDEGIKLYNTFEFRAARAAQGDNPAVVAEDREDLEVVLQKFDNHYGHKKYRALKRQAFLNRKQNDGESIMDFVADIKDKVKDCDYGDAQESVLIDKIINGVQDTHVQMRLLDLEDSELTLEQVIRICRSSELTQEQITKNPKDGATANVNMVGRGQRPMRGRGGRSRSRGFRGRSRGRGRQWNNDYGSICFKCERNHNGNECQAANRYCGVCGQIGHFARSRVCEKNDNKNNRGRFHSRGRFQSRDRRGGRNVNYVQQNDEMDNMTDMFEQCEFKEIFTCFNVSDNKNDYWYVNMMAYGKPLRLIIDSGAMCNVLTTKMLSKLNIEIPMSKSKVLLRGFHSGPVQAHGCIMLECEYKGIWKNLEFQIVDDKRELALLGKQDCESFDLIRRVNMVDDSPNENLLNKYKDVFCENIGCVPGEVNIKLNPDVEPVICPPRPIPAAIRDQVKKELDHLEKCEIIKKVTEPTRWVNPMVCVRKPNGRVRLCIDPHRLNQAILREHYPLCSIDDVTTRLNGSKYFSVLDANMGYYQLKLNDKSSYYTTFNTPFGRYRHLRMAMGISSAPEIFQRVMTDLFGDLEGVEIVMDDMLVHGKTLEEHNNRLEAVLKRARENDLKLNPKKSKIAQSEVKYIGHIITGEGLKPSPERIESIVDMKRPENFAELESWLGMIAYVAKFIPNLSEVNAKLRELKKEEMWEWKSEHETAFRNIITLLKSAPCLKFYDVNKPVLVSVDASSKGLGAACLQDSGVIAYASRALTPTEQKYAQIEKEMLAVQFGCLRFHKLIYAKTDVTVHSDHKPLEALLKKPIHRSPLRIQRMLLRLQPYTFKLMYVRGKAMGLADCLSRLSIGKNPREDECLDEELMVCLIDTLAGTNYDQLVHATNMDDELQAVKWYIQSGWPEHRAEVDTKASAYWDVRDELSTYNGIVFRGDRVCIPTSMKSEMLRSVHKAHMGIVKTKHFARDIVYWAGMSKQIEDMIGKCSVCKLNQNKQAKEPMVIHPLPQRMWQKVGSDLFVFNSVYYLVLVDYYSGFIEVDQLQDITTAQVIDKMKAHIARYGIMDTLVTDGGSQYTSGEFQTFRKKYGFNHNISSPNHQQANGLAENAVKQMKHLLKKVSEENGDFHLALLDLRNTPRNENLGSPAQRFLSRRTKTLMPTSVAALQPKIVDPGVVQEELLEKRLKQKMYYDKNVRQLPKIETGDAVRISTQNGWQPAEYISEQGMPRSHIVKAGDQGREYRRNRRDILKTRENPHQISPKKPLYGPIRCNRENQEGGAVKQVVDSRNTVRTDGGSCVRTEQRSVPENRPRTRLAAGKSIAKPAWMKEFGK